MMKESIQCVLTRAPRPEKGQVLVTSITSLNVLVNFFRVVEVFYGYHSK